MSLSIAGVKTNLLHFLYVCETSALGYLFVTDGMIDGFGPCGPDDVEVLRLLD